MVYKLFETIKKLRRTIGAQFAPLWIREQLKGIQNAIEYQTTMLEKRLAHDTAIDPTLKSQNGQDAFVANFFDHKKEGVYVELGAYDGITFSNTYHLEQNLQWSGILIEPIKAQYQKIKNHRSNQNIVLNLAVSSKKTKVHFHVHETDILSSISKTKNSTIIEIPAKRLDTIFEEHNITHIDYVSLDIEGDEHDALQSINFDKVSITLIGIESNDPEHQKKIAKYITSKGFTYLIQKGADYFYVNNNYSG